MTQGCHRAGAIISGVLSIDSGEAMETSVRVRQLDFPVVKIYWYRPQEDITTHELALVLPIVVEAGHERVRRGNLVRRIETLPESARRHFVLC